MKCLVDKPGKSIHRTHLTVVSRKRRQKMRRWKNCWRYCSVEIRSCFHYSVMYW